MQPIITPELLETLNITLSDSDKQTLLAHLNDTLQERVGAEVTEALDDDQLQTLLELQENADVPAVAEWLQANVPDLETIVQDEIDILLGEVAENSEQINNVG